MRLTLKKKDSVILCAGMCRSLFCLHSSIQFALNILFRHVFTCFLFDVHDCLQFLTRKKASNFCTYHWSLIITTCTFRSSKTTCRDIRLNCSASRGVRSENHTHVSRGPTEGVCRYGSGRPGGIQLRAYINYDSW